MGWRFGWLNLAVHVSATLIIFAWFLLASAFRMTTIRNV